MFFYYLLSMQNKLCRNLRQNLFYSITKVSNLMEHTSINQNNLFQLIIEIFFKIDEQIMESKFDMNRFFQTPILKYKHCILQ